MTTPKKTKERLSFAKRAIRLLSAQQRDIAVALLMNVPLDAEKPLVVTVMEEPKKRGIDQNGYYWLRLSEIAGQAWFNGKQYGKEVWHEYARQNIMPDEITTKDGEVRSKYVPSPSGCNVIISTTMLEKKCFADYCTALEAFGAGLGVMFSANPNER